MSGSARGVRSNAHSYRNWGEGLGNDPSYPAAKPIPRLDYCNSPDGEMKLRELFDTLIHNRYYFFDGSR